LTNVIKHTAATRIDLRLVVTPANVVLTVRDNGVGLPPVAARGSGLGFASMRHRASAIGARLSVTSPRGGGTEVRLECPQGPPVIAKRRRSRARDEAVAETESRASHPSR
jgi:signal transduction histidine kinase